MAIEETIPFNFDDTYKFIENKFISAGYDVQEGSNTMQLVTAMSYLTSMLNVNTAVNINETLLPLARKRNMIIKDAQVLGYELDHKRSYQYRVQIRIKNDSNNDIIKQIPKYTKFVSDDKNYYYMGDEISLDVPANSTVDTEIIIKEGNLIRYTDTNQPSLSVVIRGYTDGNGQPQAIHYIDVPYTDIEEDGIDIFMTYYDEFGIFHDKEEWDRSKQFMIDKDSVLSKEYVRIDNIEYRTPRLYFKIGDVGQTLRVGTIANMNVLQSSGKDGFITGALKTDDDIEVLSYDIEMVGSDEESNESIKNNAPLFHNTANRIITRNDYLAFGNRQAKVKTSCVWDGHEELPKMPGHIWFSFLSNNINRQIISSDNKNISFNLHRVDDTNNWYLDQNLDTIDPDIQEIYDNLSEYKIPTLVFHHRNPVFMDFEYDVKIAKYVGSRTNAEINKSVFDVINTFFSGYNENGEKVNLKPIESFGIEYFQSNLNKRIDTDLTDITGFDLDLKTSIRLVKEHISKDERVSVYDDEKNPSFYYKEIIFHLGYPYELDIDEYSREFDVSNLPIIDRRLFINNENIYVDTENPIVDMKNDVTVFNVILGNGWPGAPKSSDRTIGHYRVHHGRIKTIEVTLFITSENGHEQGLLESDFDEPREMLIKYPSNNIRFSRNTIPRLKRVSFK
jgi:hypothetical protein